MLEPVIWVMQSVNGMHTFLGYSPTVNFEMHLCGQCMGTNKVIVHHTILGISTPLQLPVKSFKRVPIHHWWWCSKEMWDFYIDEGGTCVCTFVLRFFSLISLWEILIEKFIHYFNICTVCENQFGACCLFCSLFSTSCSFQVAKLPRCVKDILCAVMSIYEKILMTT